MVINISVQYNGGFLPDITLLTQGYLHRDIRLNTMKKLCICSLCYLEVYWPCAGGLSAVNAIGTQLRDPIDSGLTRWRMAVS